MITINNVMVVFEMLDRRRSSHAALALRFYDH